MLDKNVLIACIFVGLALVIYFFYWNRFLALVISLFIRALYWNREGSRAWVGIGSIHFSLLAGRVLLKDVCYYSGNQTIKVVKGQIQWRYWIRRPTAEDELSSPTGEDPKPASRPLSCRIQISLYGFEWFLYNRTAAYDSIISQMKEENRSSNDRRNSAAYHSRPASATPLYTSKTSRFRVPRIVRNALQWIRDQLPSLDPMDLFPIGIEGFKGAIVLGNQSTAYLFVSEFQRAEGTYGYVAAKSKLDPYRALLTVRFQHNTIGYVENEAYVHPTTTIGQVVHDCIAQYSLPNQNLHSHSFAKLWHQLKLFTFTDRYMASQRGSQRQKASLRNSSRAMNDRQDEATPIGVDFTQLEYAKDTKLLEAPVIDVSYSFDAPGQVPANAGSASSNTKGHHNIGNGDTDPEWGIDVVIYAGLIRYGPWADRQRADLQKLFFPPSWQDADVTPQLKPGDLRCWTALQVLVELRDSTVLQIPFREASKDWQWDGKCEVPNRPRKREPACIQVTAGDCSSIRLTVPMVVESNGYESTLEVHLDSATVTSSLNDIRLVQAEACRVHCGMPTPLRWNDERTWHISVTLRDPVLYLIRDHINMFMDLGKDWAYGPPHDYRHFIPTVYVVDFNVHHYDLNLYLNDNNIIDRPHINDENVLLKASASLAKSKVTIPANIFRPEKTAIPFVLEAPDPLLRLSLPRWNTNALHAPRDGNTLGRAGLVRLDGSYLYFSQLKEDNVEQLQLKIVGRDVVYKALGWSIRYFMVLKDNYFGSFTHFSTLSEFLKRKEERSPFGDPISLKYRPGKANMLQVTLMVDVAAGTIILPVGLSGHEPASEGSKPIGHGIGACLALSVPELQMHLRLHDHFMEMSLNLDTISGWIEQDYPERLNIARRRYEKVQDLILIDGIDIGAHRLFGPPPRTATYVCIWEIQLGQVRTILSAPDARILAAAGNAFRINFTDIVNAPSSEFLPLIEPDVTFVKVSIRGYDATWQTDRAALSLEMPVGLSVDVNDLGGQHHKRVTSVRIPVISLKLLMRGKQERSPWLEAALLETHVSFDIYAAPIQHRVHTRKQIVFIQEQDRPSGRVRHMFGHYLHSPDCNPNRQSGGRSHLNGVFLPRPVVPDMTHETHPKNEARLSTKIQFDRHVQRLHGPTDSSDSDTETGTPEAERDARLAKARASTPLPRSISEEESMTSGDESDDADLTGSTPDNFWSDEDRSDTSGAEETLLLLYSRICRHYKLRRSPAVIWEGLPYILVKDKKILSLGSSLVSCTANETPPNAVKYSDNCNVITLQLRFTRQSEFRLTPLVIPALALLEEDMERSLLLGSGLWIDSLLINQLDEYKGTATRFNWTARLSSAVLQIGQHIAMTDDSHPIISLDLETTRTPSKLDNMAIFEVKLDNFATSGTAKGEDKRFQCSFGSLSATMRTAMDKPAILSSLSGETSFDISLTASSFSIGPTSKDVDPGPINFSVGQRAPEFALAAGLAVAQNVKQARAITKRWKEFTDANQRMTVFNILTSSKDIPLVEPLSTIQPSYLVQRGIPWNIRTDPKFKFLSHLRDCLWNHKPGPIQGTILVENASLRSELESRIRALDPDVEVSSIESLFYPFRQESGDVIRQSEANHQISVKSGSITIGITLPSGKSGGQFYVSELRAVIHSASCDVFRTAVKDLSQTSFRGEKRVLARKTIASFIIGDVTLTLLPHTMTFLQHIAHFGPSLLGEAPTAPRTSRAKRRQKFVNVEATIALQHLHIQAAAENLVFEIGASQMQAALSSLSRWQDNKDHSLNGTIFMGDAYVRARSPQTAHVDCQDILAALELAAVKLNVVTRQEARSGMRMRLVLSSDDAEINVPRSALRLYRFIEEWRGDYLPGLESTFSSLLSELKGSNKPSISSSFARPAVVQLHGKLAHLGVTLQVMHGTWVSWDIHNIIGYSASANSSSVGTYTYGLQTSSMTLSVSTKAATEVKMALPPFTVTGRYDGLAVHVLALVDFIDLKIKPVHWDKLLVIQQKFGQDFNDLISLVQETRSKASMSAAQTSVRRESRLKYGGFLKMRGFRIGLEGMGSNLYLECQDIRSGLDSAANNTWHIGLSNLALSLAPRSGVGKHGPSFNRRHRSAFVIIDIMVSTESRTPAFLDVEKRLRISVTKIHAVMQARFINEMSDFVDELHIEVLSRKEQRSLELAAFKEKTRSILETFEVGLKDISSEQTASWLDTYVIDIVVQNFGVAIPLTYDHDLQLPERRAQDTAAVRAFLFSIAKIEFGAHRGETGQAAITNLSFQFVPRFRQSVPNDFLGENHQTRNRLLYPEMRARIQSSQSFSLRQMWMGAIVNGFILDFDSTIPEYIFSAIDVYHQGRESVERMSATVPRPQWSPTHSPLKARAEELVVATFRVFASLKFSSGKIRLFSEQAFDTTKSLFSTPTPKGIADEQLLRLGVEIFNLPEVSVWAEYRATPSPKSNMPYSEPSTVMFKSTVHSSENTLRPTMLHFLTEVVNSIESRLRNASHRRPSRSSLAVPKLPTSPWSFQNDEIIPANLGLRISFSLRIDQSKLELTCLPDVNVMAGLHWESGGFVVNIFPAAQKATFTGTVSGLTAGLKHGFLSEDCVRLDARNLAFTVIFARLLDQSPHAADFLSVVLDTEFLGSLRFSRLQDVLCFKAVWLDNIPVLNSQISPPSKAVKSTSASGNNSSMHSLTTAILVRIRKIKAEVDLGQSISTVTMDLSNAVLRTRLSDSMRELSISVEAFMVNAKGNVAGCMQVQDCVFQTSQSMGDDSLSQGRMLDLRMTSGPVSIDLQSEHQRLLRYRAEPLAVEIYDDWSDQPPSRHAEGKTLHLAFTVACSEILAIATVGTIPRMMSYANRFEVNLKSQREGASKESATFNKSRTPKVGNPLSTVAEAMLQSAKTRLKQAENAVAYLIQQHINFRLNRLQLVAFPRTMEDTELASFIGENLRARLNRIAEGDEARRDLRLSFSSLAISRYGQILRNAERDESQTHEWVRALLSGATEATIVGLPAMRMHMISEESLSGQVKHLSYEFYSEFIRHDGAKQQEDIFITLNMSLYSWLTILRKNLAREMEQVRNAAERQPVGPGPVSTLPPVRQGPDPGEVSVAALAEDKPPSSLPIPPAPELVPHSSSSGGSQAEVVYVPRSRRIERLKMRQLGEATPDVMHPFFMKKSGFNLEESLPQYVNEYATTPLEEIMEVLLKLYSRQIPSGKKQNES